MGYLPPPLRNTTHLFLVKPHPLTLQTIQAPLARESPPISWFFATPVSLKTQVFSELQKVFYPSPHLIFFLKLNF